MFYTISMTIVAMTFGGILEYSGMLKAIITKILKIAKGTGGLIASVIISCIGTNASCSEQYISIVVPSRMYINTFLERRLHPKNLSRALEDGGTVTSVFFLWNTCGVFIAQTLNVNVLEYGIYAIFNYTVPIISVIFGYVGFKIIKINEEEYKAFKNKLLNNRNEEVLGQKCLSTFILGTLFVIVFVKLLFIILSCYVKENNDWSDCYRYCLL